MPDERHANALHRPVPQSLLGANRGRTPSTRRGWSRVKNVSRYEYRDPDQEISPEDKEEATDLQEEQDALDVESEYPYEQDFDKAQDWEPSGEITYNPDI